jgi:hypothetical protein
MGLMLKLKPAPFIFILSAFLLGISFYWRLGNGRRGPNYTI